MDDARNDALLSELIALCDDLAWGRRTDPSRLYELTRADAGPEELVRLAEAFGMMLVRVEGREYQTANLVEELRESQRRLTSRNISLQHAVQERFALDGQGIVAGCRAMRMVVDLAMSIARHPINTLILGPTGTGKEVVAKLIHFNSVRRDKPFIAVNCSAIPESLFESEMFGIEKGVATGVGARRGLIEEADGGTLFLDELGELSPAHQTKLLRVLEERSVLRVGSSKPVPVDIHLISATNASLERMVREGTFREDLYYRVNVAELRLPALKDRGDDVLLLAGRFLETHCRSMGRPVLSIPPAVRQILTDYPWPGNVRELNNEMERAAALTTGDELTVDDLSPRIVAGAAAAACPAAEPDPSKAVDRDGTPGSDRDADPEDDAFNLVMAEERLVRKALDVTGGNRSRAARLLGITREGLRKKLLRMDIR